MASLLSLLNPKNLLIAALSVALAGTWFAYDLKKHEALKCSGEMALCEANVRGYQAEISTANSIIEALKGNLAAIRRQMDEWKRIAADAEAFSDRLLAAAEGRKDCEVYHAENARLVDEFVDGFNARVRGKVKHPAAAGDRPAAEVLPAAGAADAAPGHQ